MVCLGSEVSLSFSILKARLAAPPPRSGQVSQRVFGGFFVRYGLEPIQREIQLGIGRFDFRFDLESAVAIGGFAPFSGGRFGVDVAQSAEERKRFMIILAPSLSYREVLAGATTGVVFAYRTRT